MTSSHPNLHGVYLNKHKSQYIETTMHNKPVKVHIQIKDRIKSQVIKKNKCAPKKIKIQDIPLIIQGNIA